MAVDSYSNLSDVSQPTIGSAPVDFIPMGLAGRLAFCTYDHEFLTPEQKRESLMDSPQPSSNDLPNFEYRGPGSIWATAYCLDCGQGKTAHTNQELIRAEKVCRSFVARGPALNDIFYCRCRGLDPTLDVTNDDYRMAIP